MFLTFLFIGYSRTTSNYPLRITLFDLTHMMSMVEVVAISLETLRINSESSLKKEFTQLISMNLCMVLYLIVSQVNPCHDFACGPLTWDTKDILWMDDHVLMITYESLATGSLKCHILDTTWSPWRWLCGQDGIVHPRYLRKLTQGMGCDVILGQGSKNIWGVLDDFLHVLVLTWVTN